MNSKFQLLPSSTFHFTGAPLLSVLLLFGLIACGEQNNTGKKLAEDTSSVQNFDSNLIFNDVTLEQTNDLGQPIWKVQAKQALYSKDKKVAQVQSPTGELFQDGKPVYQITAQNGEIQQDGKQLFLKGQIVATDPQNGVVLRGNELEWRPQEDLLIVRNQLTGTHRQVHVVAREARAFSKSDRIELQGGVVAITNDPVLQMRTEHLLWQIREQKLLGDRPVQIDRYKGKAITDRATANSSEYNLQTKIATLKQNAQLNLLDPSLQVTTKELNWNLNAETVMAKQPVRIVNPQQQITVTAKQGRMDLQKKVVYLTGDVYGVGQRSQSINAKALTWYLPTQLVEAQGNVIYRQAEPPVSLAGQKAVGKLREQNIVVSGGRVVTEIIP